MKGRRDKWIDRLLGRRRVRDRPAARLTRTRRAAQLIRYRRIESSGLAATQRHLRSVAREGDDGHRCFDCQHIPLHPWEPVLEDA